MLIFHEPEASIAHLKDMIADLTRLMRKWERLFELGHYEINVYFEEQPLDEHGKPEDITPESASAETKCQPEYFQAQIRYYLKALVMKKRQKQLEVYARHELLHVVLAPYANFVDALTAELHPQEDGSFAASVGIHEETLVSTIEGWKLWDKLK